ncbi:hypothetical protein BC831DRAFT_490123, partial [Entophlyctis helioformis]
MRAQQQRAMPDPDAAALAAQLHTSNNEPNDNDARRRRQHGYGTALACWTSPSGRLRGSLLKVACSRHPAGHAAEQRGRGRLRGVPNKAGGQKAGCRQASSKGRWQDGR